MASLVGTLWQDLRFALRNLDKDRRFTVLAVLALSFGHLLRRLRVLIDTFPYAHFDRMVSFSINGPGRSWGREMLSVPEFLDFRDQNHVFLDMDSGNAGQPFLYRHDRIFFGVSLFRPLDHSRRHQSQCAAGFQDELQGLEGAVRQGSQHRRKNFQPQRPALDSHWHHAAASIRAIPGPSPPSSSSRSQSACWLVSSLPAAQQGLTRYRCPPLRVVGRVHTDR